MSYRINILQSIIRERIRQDEIWGPQDNHSLETWLTILVEEVGEIAEAILEHSPSEPSKLREELVQAAAVIVSMIEHLDRGAFK